MQPLPLDSASFREVASRYATGLVVATVVDGDFDHAMTATSFTTVSLDPLLVLICVERDTRFHDALCIGVTPEYPEPARPVWGISILAESAKPAASWFSTQGRPLIGQFERTAHYRGDQTGAILLEDSLATMEVRTRVEYPAGDHTIVVGDVLSLACDSDRPAEPEEESSVRPLLYWARRYRGLSD